MILEDPIISRAREIAEEVTSALNYELFDFQFRKEGRRWIMKVTIDKMEGYVGIKDCEAVSREMEKILDAEDFIPQSYVLEVSSPGLDRPLRNMKDYLRFKGKLAKFVLKELLEKKKTVVGWIEDVDESHEEITVKEKGSGRILKIPLLNVKKANLEIEF
ncbi:MAG: ribosome maturation factor RimP [Thermotogae bacterium]|nr:ribosome maturation factor RimP [Thermotogota bacterium]